MTFGKPVRFFAGALLVSLLFQFPAFALPLSAPVPVTVVYTYDTASRLTGETRTDSQPYALTYAYDKAGNRTQQTRDGTKPHAQSVKAALEFAARAVETGRYDAALMNPQGRKTHR